ncbi:MAG: tRNA (adenosine(37)-N6)-dimethylallyltransferase MiaA [Proteobacteria bacterium]|nr:tRNA (adenosine(37)-N6)-dimethylallyltransferase MiaA [Pseudomonadota bacterium]
MSDNKPILIAGPTASGKSALAIKLAQKTGGAIINADALQIYEGWNILSARPGKDELLQCPHYMYGHVAMDQPYSVGSWLRDIKQQLLHCKEQGQRPIIVGGTGLYFSTLTHGLSDIPSIPADIRQEADHMRETLGRDVFAGLLAKSDPETYARIDVQNPVRTQRAWEVLQATGTGLSKWQENRQEPLIAEKDAHLFVLVSDTDWLNARIDRRFDLMLDQGALDECRVAMDSWWDAALPSCKAIGAKELISYLNHTLELTEAVETAKLHSRRYAKKQRTWFRNRMQMWQKLDIPDSNIDLSKTI